MTGKSSPDSERFGPNRDAVSAYLATLTLDARGIALAAVALTLAKTLDDGAGGNTAPISKELRATLEALDATGEDDDPFIGGLSAPLGDETD